MIALAFILGAALGYAVTHYILKRAYALALALLLTMNDEDWTPPDPPEWVHHISSN